MKTKNLIIALVSFGVISGGVLTFFVNNREPEQIEISGMMPLYSEDEIILNSELVVSGTVKSIGDGRWSNPDLEPNKSKSVTLTSTDKKFENESVSGLSERIKELKKNNPDWAEKQAIKREKIRENNKKLFGE